MVIAAARRTTHYMAKDAHFRKPLVRTLMNQTGQIETKRETGASDALKKSVKVLKANRALEFSGGDTFQRKENHTYSQVKLELQELHPLNQMLSLFRWH